MTDTDWNNLFDKLLSQYLIDMPPNYYAEKTGFDNPDQLGQMFAELEEKNLYLIHIFQELE